MRDCGSSYLRSSAVEEDSSWGSPVLRGMGSDDPHPLRQEASAHRSSASPPLPRSGFVQRWARSSRNRWATSSRNEGRLHPESARTAIGTFAGSLKDVPAATLGAVAIGAAVARAKLRSDEVETVVMGNVVQAGTKMNPARQAAVHAGLRVTTPALTVNRVCGSGAQAIVSAAQDI